MQSDKPTHALASPLFFQMLKEATPRPSGLTFMGVPIVWDPIDSHHKSDMVDAVRYTWSTFHDGFGLTPQEKADMTKSEHLFPTCFGIDPARKPKKLPPYRTVGVRFIHGHNLLKVYTYRVRKAAKVHLGQEVIVESNPPSGWTKSLAVIVRIDTTPQDNGPFNYLLIEQAVKAL